MTVLMYLVVSTGLIASVVLHALAIAKGRATPIHRVPWVIALVILGIDTALHVVASVEVVISGGAEGGWFVLGTIVPLAFALGGLNVPAETEGAPPLAVVLIAYSVPATVRGGLIVLSTWAPRRASSDSSSRVRTPALR